MRIRWRSRICYKLLLRNCMVKGLRHVVLCIRFFRYHAYVLLTMLLLLLLWWNASEMEDCGAHRVVEKVCEEFKSRDTAGNLCKGLCETGEIKPGLCYQLQHGVKSFRFQGLVTKIASSHEYLWQRDTLSEGLAMNAFIHSVEQYIETQLGVTSSTKLVARLLKHVDVNSDDKLNLGEAQNLWRLLHQPFFLVFYLFQIIMRNLENHPGIKMGGQNINNLRYADNTMLIAKNKEDLQKLLNIVEEESRKKGLELNSKKTEVMVISRKQESPK
ncbi:protein fam69b-like [Plakobranchus ocellatus]|uniref:Protein fam69b-like n=1 Tax=Plakobranchus ocellatus TaxID=259542 RepID=A0AAV4DNB4_9GAST|nr:protein fam69b-like [Plakobranchus ocellatus]